MSLARAMPVAAGGALLSSVGCEGANDGSGASEPNDERARAQERFVAALREVAGGDSRFDPSSAGLGAAELPFDDARARAKLTGMIGPVRIDQLAASRDALRRHLAERHRADLAASRTAYVDGWLLSQTEISVLVLAALEEVEQ